MKHNTVQIEPEHGRLAQNVGSCLRDEYICAKALCGSSGERIKFADRIPHSVGNAVGELPEQTRFMIR